MGIWNVHTSLGNILGALVAGALIDETWAFSFIVPGCIIAGMGVIVFLFLIECKLQCTCNSNDLPLQICNISNLNIVKIKLKTTLFNLAYV